MKNVLTLAGAGLMLFVLSCKGPAKQETTSADTVKKDSVTTPVTKTAEVASTDEYQINVPEGWLQSQQQLQNYRMTVLAAPFEHAYKPNLTILRDDMKGKTLDQFVEGSMKQLAPLHVVMGKTGEININGVKGRFLTYTFNYQRNDVSIKTYILPKNSSAYILTASSLITQADQYLPDFDKAVDSFKLK